jgi:murein DD-endopeptidase MepM/ murein hydrolase activator NlpD
MPDTEGFMSVRMLRRLVVLAVASCASGWLYLSGLNLRDIASLVHGTPHQRYAATLKYRGTAATAAGRAWLEAAEQSLMSASTVTLPRQATLHYSDGDPAALAYAVSLRRGQRYVVEVESDASQANEPVFLDVFERRGTAMRPVESAPSNASAIALEIRADGDYIVRVQPPIERAATLALRLRAEPTLRVPVQRSGPSSIQSFFGDTRDGGRRTHHGVDIFARRGTPVIAAADGIVSSVGKNGLGGNVVWVARPGRRELHYYAHLDQQLVVPGTLVSAGDVLGTVGNTGNARHTPPHLHFGIYAAGGPVDPLPYIVPRSG